MSYCFATRLGLSPATIVCGDTPSSVDASSVDTLSVEPASVGRVGHPDRSTLSVDDAHGTSGIGRDQDRARRAADSCFGDAFAPTVVVDELTRSSMSNSVGDLAQAVVRPGSCRSARPATCRRRASRPVGGQRRGGRRGRGRHLVRSSSSACTGVVPSARTPVAVGATTAASNSSDAGRARTRQRRVPRVMISMRTA